MLTVAPKSVVGIGLRVAAATEDVAVAAAEPAFELPPQPAATMAVTVNVSAMSVACNTVILRRFG
jgi:hypothetical protein